jgi:hypothetical protein
MGRRGNGGLCTPPSERYWSVLSSNFLFWKFFQHHPSSRKPFMIFFSNEPWNCTLSSLVTYNTTIQYWSPTSRDVAELVFKYPPSLSRARLLSLR